MIIEKPVIQFWEYMQSLRSELDCAVRREYTRKGITLTPSQCKIDLLYHPDTESFYVEMQNTLTTPSDCRTENLHAPRHVLESVTMAYLAERIIAQFIDQIRHRIELAFVRATLEQQDMSCIGKKISAKKATVDALWDSLGVLYMGSLVIDCPKAWGGRGYSTLNYRIYSCGKDDTLRYGIYGEVIDYHSDATAGLPVQLPFIEATPAQLADFAGTTREWAAFLRGDK